MKREYDFSNGVRGKFFKENIIINLPVYLEPEQLRFVKQIAEKQNKDLTVVVNDLIKKSKKFAQSLQ